MAKSGHLTVVSHELRVSIYPKRHIRRKSLTIPNTYHQCVSALLSITELKL